MNQLVKKIQEDDNKASSSHQPAWPSKSNITEKVNVSKMIKIESGILKPPLEYMKSNFRKNQKLIEKEMMVCIKAADQLDAKKKGETFNQEQSQAYIDKFLNKLEGIKHRINDIHDVDVSMLDACKHRVEYVEQLATLEGDDAAVQMKRKKWFEVRLNRLVVDQLMRKGYFDTALALANHTNIQKLVDIDIFKNAQLIEKTLKENRIEEALQWCQEHKSKLKQTEYRFEFDLHLQAFIELIRKHKKMKAIQYAKKHICVDQFKENFAKDIKTAMGLLAFDSDTTVERYSHYYDQNRWQKLQHAFRAANHHIYGLTNFSPFKITLQAGLTALKTPLSSEQYSIHDPLCHEPFQSLAVPLPYASPGHTYITCRLNSERINEDNPMLYFPKSGQGYGRNALSQMAAKNRGMVIDPISKEKVKFSQLKRVYFV